MKRDYKLYINNIIESINKIEEYVKDISEEEFKGDIKLQDAVIRRLEIIGEASRNIPRSLKEKNKDIPWFKMAQFRDFIVHSYFESSLQRIWITIKRDVIPLQNLFKNISLV